MQAYTRVKFFKHLDFISISAYYKMLSGKRGPSPTHKRTKEMFAARLRRLEKWRRQSNLEDKDVLIAEVGYQSKGKKEHILSSINTVSTFFVCEFFFRNTKLRISEIDD